MPDLDTPQHIALPLCFEDGCTLTIDQDSDEEIDTNVLVAVSYPRGYLEHDATFGAKPSPFRQGGANIEQIAARVQQVEERATLDDVTHVLERLRERIGFDPTPAA